MNIILPIFLAIALGLSSCTSTYEDSMKVYFSPKGGAEEAIVEAIENAQSEILVQAYSLTSQPIVDALIKVHQDNVNVRLILDRRAETGEKEKNALRQLNTEKIYVKIDTVVGLAHKKVMIIDSIITITGSFNYSKSAEEKNRENLIVIRDRTIAMDYLDHWNMRDSASRIAKKRLKRQ